MKGSDNRMVSTLHITLSYNLPERSVSCEDNLSSISKVNSSLPVPTRATSLSCENNLSSISKIDSSLPVSTTRSTSFSSSNVSYSNVPHSNGISRRYGSGGRSSSVSCHSLFGPIPYSSKPNSKPPSWSPVKFQPRPLSGSMKNFQNFLDDRETFAKSSKLERTSWASRGQVAGSSSSRPTKLAVVNPLKKESSPAPDNSTSTVLNPKVDSKPFLSGSQNCSSSSSPQRLSGEGVGGSWRQSVEKQGWASKELKSSSTPWRHPPCKLGSASLAVFENKKSVAGGSLRQGVGGGVMEDGTTHAPLVPRVAVSSNANPSFGQRKSSSLPGYYSRSPQHLSPHSFRDAFTNSRSPTPTHQDVQANPPRGHNAPSASQPRVATVTAMVNHQQQQQKQQQQQQQQQKQRYPQLQHQPQHLQQQIPLQRQQHVHPNERQQSQKQKQNILQQQIPPHQYQKQQQVPNIYKKQQQEEQNYQDVRHQKQLRQDLPKQHQQQQQQQQKQQQQQQRAKQAHYEVQRQVQPQKSVSEKAPPQPEKKSKRSLLSGIFRRRKKEASSSSSSSSSSESEEPPQQRRTFLRRRFKKKESKDPLPPPPPPPPDETTGPQLSSVRVMAELDSGKNNEMVQEAKYVRTQDGRRLVRVIPNSTGSLGRDDQSLGIPVLLPEPGNLTRCGVSASHDSLPVSLGSWAGGSSHASLGYHSGGGMGARSSSTDTITKKERREALKARVERLREKFRDTSSDEDKASMSSHSTHGSESSLCKTNSLTRRSRTARTERFLRRKSQELETLRTETEKDRRNREVVQARIQEIQRIREIEAERNKINEEKMLQLPEKNKPKWSAKLVYQESSEYESSFVLRTPSVSPAASPHTKPKFQGHSQANTNEMKDGVILRHKPQASASVSLAPPYGPTIRRSFQDFENTPHTDLRNHRSTSYDSNLNRNSLTQQPVNSFNSPQTSNKARVNKYGLTPPPPPPRDKSRILSPGDGRPMSFSFENLNQDSNRPNSSQSSRSNFTKGSSPSPSVRSVPAYLGPKSNMQQKQPSPINAPSRPSFSELHLPTQEQAQYGSNNSQPPARPIPPGNTATYRYRYTDQPPTLIQQNLCNQIQSPPHHQPSRQPSQQMQLQPNSNQVQYYTDQSPQYAKVIPISNVPPSPSSDYSSYMSDNSLRIQQISTAAWLKNEQDAKNKIGNVIASQAISDSSRSNSPKVEHCNSTGAQKEGIYASIQTKKARPAPLTLKQAESLSSLSGQSDVSSPVPKALDSDSSQSSLAKEKKEVKQNRPLSMVLEKSESAEKESPPHTPKTRPQPPRRGNRQLNVPGTDLTKRQMLQEIMKHKKENPKDKPIYQKEFQEMFRKEKERLEKSKCNNFEEALQELEEIYDSLKLDNEDLLDRAERRDLPISHQQLRETGQDAVSESQSEVGETDSTIQNRSRPRAPKSRRSGIPDKKGDDMHYRRCQQGSRNQPDVQKALQMTGSYLLVSPAHTTPSDIDKDLPKDPMLDGEPDIVYDDVSYRNIKQANSLKVIDPQPPFGVPLGPTTQGSPNDYLHVTPKENYRPKMIARKEPDVTMDDLAFRSLRKDQQSGKEVNVSELDELLSETTTDSPVYKKKTIRSVSADRARSLRDNQEQDCSSYKQKEKNSAPHKQDKNTKQQTPRRVKHQNEARRAGRFFESYKDAVTDGDGLSGSPLSPRHNNPSWLERANLVESKWDNLSTNNLSTSTETLTEMSSARAVSQPDIRQAIIREARAPPGGPMEFKSSLPTSSSVKPSLAAISVPNLAKLQTIQSAPSSPAVVEKKPYRPLDSIFNNKPKPFYLVDNKPSNPTQQNHVDIAKLDALISTLSKIETNEEISDESSLASKTPTEESLKTIVPNELEIEEESTHENISAPQRSVPSSNTLADFDDEKYSAKVNIQKAIRLSMAKESSNSEGECDDDQESGAAHQNTKGRQAVRQTRRSPTSATKQTEKSKADSEKLRTKRRQPDPPKDRKSDADRLREREKRDKRLEYARLKVDEREKRKSGRERASPSADNKVKKPQEKKKSIESREKSEGKEKRPRSDHQQRKGEEREKRKSQEFKPNRDKKKSVETNSEERRVEEEEDVQKEEKDNKSLSPERDDEMVHHKSSGNDGVGEGGGTTTLTETERAEQERRERIQRYKEERRKQIAARYGTAEWSSSDDSGGGEDSSYRAYRRRRRAARDNHDTSSTEHSNHDHRRTQENGSSSLEGRGPLRMVGGSSSEDVVMGVSVRSTRASRLRQAAQSSSTLNNNNNNNNNNSCSNNNAAGSSNNNTLPDVIEGAALQTDGVSERARGEPPADSSALKRLPNQVEGRVDSADSTTLSGSDGRSGRRGGVAGEERDKSHKRKSNLNRSTTSEVLPPEPLLPPHPSDSNEETPRRRRRRGPVSPVNTSIASVATPEPLKTPEVLRHVVSRLTPPASPPTHPPTQPSPPTARQRLSPQPTVPPHSFQPIQPAASHSTQSAPSTLDSRTRLSQGITSESSQHDTQYVSGALAAERSDRSETEDGNTRKLPPKLAPLRKPEIPDVLRPKDTSSLASPGVVNTPPNSRPSSVVLEKPPLAPEGIRPAVLRSSLRKPPDTGTCFMATRREKLNDSKPDIFREIQQRPRKGDRLSKSDMNLKVDPSQSNKQSDASSPGAIDSEPSGSSSSPTLPGAHISSCDEVISSRLESLTTHARDTMERADRLVESSLASSGSSSRENSADNVVHECEEYLSVNASSMDLGMSSARSREAVTATNHSDSSPTLPAMKGLVSDTGQKNWVGGSEGHGKESKWMAIEKEVNRDCRHDTNQATSFENANMVTTSPSGPPNHESYVNDNMHFPLEEEARDLRQLEYEDEDLGSPDSVMKSPEYRSKRGSRRCSLDGGSPRTNSPDPQSILKRRSSREDVAIDRPTTPEPHSILKRKSSSRTSSIDTVEGEPKPILKKKSSNEELDHFEPRPILKKKSSTDDELDDRPRSILKGGRSREDLDRVEGVISPTPILKRSPRCEYEAESELRPILKRRDTTDGVRLRLHVSDGEDVDSDAPSVRVRSDSAPEAAIRMRGRSPPAPSATPHHGILKKRGAHSPARHDAVDSELGAILRSRRSMAPEDTESSADSPSDRPVSPSLIALTRRETSTVRGERPLSVAERVAGMEAARQEPPTPHRQRSPTPTQSPGARPKVMPSTLERSPTHNKERESGKHCAFDLTPETPSPGVGVEAINEAFLHRPVAEAYNSAISPDFDTTPETPSSVSQKAAFFAQLERDQKRVQESSPVNSSNGTRFAGRRDRATRHATQPVTEEEVSQAARLADAAELTSASHESNSSSTHKDSVAWLHSTGESSSSYKAEESSSSYSAASQPNIISNSVGARVALWTRRLEEEKAPARPLDGAKSVRRRSRSARFKTQPVTLEEVAHAHALNNQNTNTTTSPRTLQEQELATGFNAAREAVLKNASDVMQGLTPGSSPRRRQGSRKSSLNEPEDDSSSDSVRGILKREGSAGGRETHRDSPRSILKHSSSDSRRASFSESDHPRSILKPESPLPPSAGSPEHEAKMLRGVLKKDSSLEDSKEIKSILKPESESLEPDHSSDSSSDDVTLTTVNTPQGLDCDLADCIKDIDPVRHKEDQPRTDSVKVDSYKTDHHRADLAEALKQVEPIKAKDDLAEALRQIEPIRAKERSREREDWLLGNVKELSTASKVTSSITAVTSQTDVVSHMTTTNTSSSSSENEIKLIKNEAVMRRKNITTRKYDERRSMVELRSLEQAMEVVDQCARASSMDQEEEEESSDSSDGTSSPISPTQYPNTLSPSDDTDRAQNLRQSPTSRKKGASPEPLGDGTKYRSSSPISSSINARLAALQKNGEDGWKNRVKKETKDVNSNVTLRPKPIGGARERPVSLMERMSALESSSQQWRGRVSQSDATQFTVAHKMASASTSSVPSLLSGTRSPIVTITPDRGTTPTGSPQVERKKRSPCQKIFKSKTGGNIPAILSKSSPSSTRRDFRRSISTPNDAEKDDRPVGTSVAVPLADDESFDAFFSRTPTSSEPSHMANSDSLVLEDADLDLISHSASQLVIKRRSVRITRRQVASRNPLKALAARKDLKSEYTEVKMGVGEKELRRMKVEELSKGSPMAVEALAGLASKENFSAVSLKKVENTPIVREMAPYTSLMLLQVKGRRHAQTRLVEPSVSSVNEGDDFVLITPTEVFHFKGGFANVIERAKAAEIAQYIVQKKDMGITTARNVIEIDTNSPGGRKTKFWKLIGGNDKSEAAPGGIPDEDEYVEASIVAANKIYEVQGDSLVPLAEHWGQMPKVEILSSDSVLVFDFGAELYIWAGKRACGDERKVGIALGRELWEEEYDYTECDINPITPMTPISKAKLKGVRPDWGVCAKLTENVETILFKEKFIDWPDLAQQSRIKEVKKELDRHIEPVCELQPCDAQKMLEELPLEPDLVLEMSHLGRGIEYYDEEERRLLSISTNDYKVWHISEYGKVLMDSNSKNQLHAGDTYVVRWYYIVTATGRTLKGEPSKHNVTGRSRVAYFFWQGQGSSVSDKGVSALMTVELDEERGPHIRVTMGKEPPAFLNLFEGGMVVHLGRRDEAQKNQQWKLFLVRGEMENEGHLIEVEVDSSHLRSRGCIVLVNLHTGTIHLWYGAKALRHTRKVGSRTASKLSEAVDELGWKDGITRKVKEQYEGAESRDFWEGFGGSSFKKRHFSLLDDGHSYNFTPRMWHLVATPDSFQTSEVVCSYRATELPNPLPLLQEDLYSVAQPALFVVDGGHQLWVWQGWWPDDSSEGEDFSATGSAVLRFNFARRAALQTALNYNQLKAKKNKTDSDAAMNEPQLVVAGMEPLEFTNLFPVWTPKSAVTAIQMKEGRWTAGGQYLVADILRQLSRTHYTLSELTAKPLPDGADPLHLEVYLGEDEFIEALGMTRDKFYSLQAWKQTELKKKAQLF